VTVVEVGVLKRAIVYHSDVLNTAARIQSLCNEYDETLLISEEIVERLNTDRYTFEEIGDLLLRGKSRHVKVYAVRDAAHSELNSPKTPPNTTNS